MMAAKENVARRLGVIAALDDRLRACIGVRREAALEEARALDGARTRGPLHGWAIAVKDNIDVIGTVRSDGLRPPLGAPAAFDAMAVARLRIAGAVVVAKANLEELSLGATTQNAYWGACRNPWDVARIPGGSSGGCAVAVATGMADAALGTDTGGSVRNPAAFCGVTALRPSPGLVPAAGVTEVSRTYDVVGPLARDAEGVGALMAALTGTGEFGAPVELSGLRVGVADVVDEVDPAVAHGWEELLVTLSAAGARLSTVRLPGAAEARDAFAVLMNAEAARRHGRRLADPRVEAGVRGRLALGLRASEDELAAARAVAARWESAVNEALGDVDVLVCPATPTVAPRIGSDALVEVSRRINHYNSLWSLARVPALALPLEARGTLPVGGQLVAARGRDARLVGVARALQACTDWHRRRPRVVSGDLVAAAAMAS